MGSLIVYWAAVSYVPVYLCNNCSRFWTSQFASVWYIGYGKVHEVQVFILGKMLKFVGILATIGSYIILVMGAVVTKTGSGEGCGDTWPLCHGELIPSSVNIELIIEYSHRIVSGLVGIIVVLFAIWAVRAIRRNKTVKWLAFGSIFFIVLQALLGAAAVKWSQSDAVLALHFGFALLCFTCVLLLMFQLFHASKSDSRHAHPVSNKFRYLVWFTAVYVYFVVYTGAYVRHAGASMGCVDFPLCNGHIIPPLSGIAGIQFGHRVAAALALIFITCMMVIAIRHYKARQDLYWGSVTAFILIVLQVLSGGLTVLTSVNLFTSLIHSTIIACLFGILCYVALQVRRSPEQVQGQPVGVGSRPENVLT